MQDNCHPGQPYHALITLLVGQYGVRIVTYSSVIKLWFTLRASASAAAPESPILLEYSRVSASSENQIMGQSVRLSMGLRCHYESVEFKNGSVAMAMITPEKVNDTCLGFNPFHINKTYIRHTTRRPHRTTVTQVRL